MLVEKIKRLEKVLQRRPGWGYGLVLGLVVLVYWGSVNNGLVWDDRAFLEWEYIGNPVANLGRYFGGELIESWLVPNYRPIKNLIFSLNYSWWGMNAWGYHLTSLAAHVLSTWLVMGLVVELGGSRIRSVLAGVVFGWHPVMVEAVAWITAGMDLWGVVFMLGAVWSYVRAVKVKSEKQRWRWASLGLAGLAVFTNELTLTLPLLLLWYEWVWGRRDIGYLVRKQWGYWGWVGLYAWIRWGVLGLWSRQEPILGEYVWNVLVGIKVAGMYVLKVVWPWPLTVNHRVWGEIFSFYYYDFPAEKVGLGLEFDVGWWWGVLVLVGVGVIWWRSWRRGEKGAVFGLGWMGIGLLPVLQLVPTTSLFSERYMYVAMAGAALVLAKWVEELLVGRAANKVLVGMVVGWWLGWGYSSFVRIGDWRDELSLWTSAAEHAPSSAMVLNNLGVAWADVGDKERAEALLERAVMANDEYVLGLANFGAVKRKKGECGEAVVWLEKSVELKPDLWEGWEELGLCMEQMEDWVGARKVWLRLWEERGSSPEYALAVGRSFHELFVLNQAEEWYKKSLDLQPDYVEGYINLARLYFDADRFEDAVAMLNTAIELEPGHELIRVNVETIKEQFEWDEIPGLRNQ